MAENAISLDGLSVSDLAALQAKIADQIKARKEESKKEAKDKILAVLAEYSFTLGDLFPSLKGGQDGAGAPKRKVRIKYSDGKNNWTGRGKKPLWVVEYLKSGGDLSSIELK